MNFNVNVNRQDLYTRIAVADENGEVIDIKEFKDRADGKGSREMRALAWTMGVLLLKVEPGAAKRWREKR